MKPAGFSLLEVAVSLALAGLLVATAARGLTTLATSLAEARGADRMLAAARNLLEAEMAAPCAAAYRCPDDLSCNIERAFVGRFRAAGAASPEAVSRIRAAVAPNQDAAGLRVELSVLAADRGGCA